MSDAIEPPLLLFDGDCNFCRASVRWLWKRDAARALTFTPLQGETGRRALTALGMSADYLDSAVLIESDATYLNSDAIVQAARHARGAGRLLHAGRFVPRFLRDAAYRWVARNRPLVSRLAGTRGERWNPPAAERDRFPDWEAGRRPA